MSERPHPGAEENRPIASLRDNLEAVASVSDEMIGIFIFGVFGALGMDQNNRRTGKAVAAHGHH